MTAGDNVYQKGSWGRFRDCYAPTWGRFRDRTRPTPGNHDWAVPGAAGYFKYFGALAGPAGRGYYAFDAGTWRVYALSGDCWAVGGCQGGSAQYRWLKASLAAHPAACVLAVWHEPRFSSGPHGSATAVRPLLKLLYAAGAEIVVNGHDHEYERFAPASPNGAADPVHGIRQFVVGHRWCAVVHLQHHACAQQRGPEQHHQGRAQADARCRELQLGVRAGRRQHLHRLRQRQLPRRAAGLRGPPAAAPVATPGCACRSC